MLTRLSAAGMVGLLLFLFLQSLPVSSVITPMPEFAVRVPAPDGVTSPIFPYEIRGLHWCETLHANIWIINVTDLYAYEFTLTFDSTWLKIADHNVSHVHTADFVVVEEVNNDAGVYTQTVAATDPAKGFNGSAVVADIWFHIEQNPYWINEYEVVLDITGKMINSYTEPIAHSYEPGYIRFISLNPKIRMLPSSIEKCTVNDTFTAQVIVQDVVKMKSFHLNISFGAGQIRTDLQSVWIEDFLPPPYEYTHIEVCPNCIIADVAIPCEEPAINGTGEILNITFTVLDPWDGHIPHYKKAGNNWIPQTCKDTVNITGYIEVYCPDYRIMNLSSSLGVTVVPGPTRIASYSFTPVTGDLNLDGQVDIQDLKAVAAKYNTADPDMDLNGDGLVDLTDIFIITREMGRTG